MNKIVLLFLIVLGISLFTCINIFDFKKEFFNNINPGNYPNSDDSELLDNFYEENNNMGLSNLNYARQSLMYPVNSATSTLNNNLKYWPLPINGLCAFPELCGNLYQPLSCELQEKENLNQITIWPKCQSPRVNFWCSTTK